MEQTYLQSPLGFLYIAADDENICEITYANSQKGRMTDESKIEITTPVSPIIKKCIQQLNEYFSGERKVFDFPVKQTGTEFQQMVWQNLMKIPYGKSISYLQLSKMINNVKAIRAAGTANGSNKINIIVPCHRVIGSNGSLVGYGGDLWRKQWLLEHEAKFGNGVQQLF